MSCLLNTSACEFCHFSATKCYLNANNFMIIMIVYASVSCLVAILFLAFYREQYKRLDLDDDKEKHLDNWKEVNQ